MKRTPARIDTTFALQLEVWRQPVSEIAQARGVSIASLEYRIHYEEIIKPPPEYWEKIKRGLSHYQALREIGWTKPMIKKIKAILLDAKSQMKNKSCPHYLETALILAFKYNNAFAG